MQQFLTILTELRDSDIDWLIEAGRLRRVERGAVLIRTGVPLDAFFVVVAGAVEVRANDHVVAVLRAGEVLGEMSFLDRKPPSATVVATEPTTVLGLPQSLLAARIEEDTGFAARFTRALARFLAARLRETNAALSQRGDAAPGGSELDLDDLDDTDVAARRFQWMLERLSGAR